jgi:hypothetical protein
MRIAEVQGEKNLYAFADTVKPILLTGRFYVLLRLKKCSSYLILKPLYAFRFRRGGWTGEVDGFGKRCDSNGRGQILAAPLVI